MAETKKMTKREVINLMLADSNIASNSMYVAYLENELSILERKSSKTTMNATQKENVAIMESILNALTEIAKPVTISDLQANNAEMAKFSNQKLSALLKKLVDSNQVVKTTDKKKSYFSVNAE